MDDFFKEASIDDALALVTLRYGNLIKEGESLSETLAQLGQGGRYEQLGNLLKRVGVGTAVGAGGGLASTLLQPQHRRRPLSRAMTGGLLGALGGGGYHLLQQTVSQLGPSSAEPQQRVDDAREALDTIEEAGVTPAARAHSTWEQLTGGDVLGAARNVVGTVAAPFQQWFANGTLEPVPGAGGGEGGGGGGEAPTPAADKGALSSPWVPVGAGGAGLAANKALENKKIRFIPERKTTAIDRLVADPEVKGLTDAQRHNLARAREQLIEGDPTTGRKGVTQGRADRTLARYGTEAPKHVDYKAQRKTHKQDIATTRAANRAASKQHQKALQRHGEAVAARQRAATQLQNRIATGQTRVQQLVDMGDWQRAHLEATKVHHDRRKLQELLGSPPPPKPQAPQLQRRAMPVPPTKPSRVPSSKDHLTGRTLRQKMRRSRPPGGAAGRWGRRGLSFLVPLLAAQAAQEYMYGNTSEALEWQRQQAERQLQAAQEAAGQGQGE